MGITEQFLTLVRNGLNLKTDIDHSFATSAGEWPLLFDVTQKQSLVGVCFAAIERLPQEQRPPKPLLLKSLRCTKGYGGIEKD